MIRNTTLSKIPAYLLLFVLITIHRNLSAQVLHQVIDNFEDTTANWIANDLVATTVTNPESTADNATDKCLKLVLSGGAYPLLKLESNTPYQFDHHPYFRMKVNGAMDRGLVMLKFENDTNTQSYYQTAFVHGKGENGWEDLTFDMRQAPSGVFTKMVLFIDLGDYNGTANDIWYVDEIERYAIIGDTEAPTPPTGLQTSDTSTAYTSLTWDKSKDNSQISGYKVYVNDALFATAKTNSLLVYDLQPSNSYSLKVQAVDAAGNVSEMSEALPITTKPETQNGIPADFNYILGTQTFKPDYQFTDANTLQETSEGIIAMGSNILKISLQPSSYIEPDPGYVAPLDALANYPFLKQAIDQEQYKYIFLWVYSPNTWVRDDGMQAYELESETQTIYDLTQYLLTTYAGTDKTFFIGNWEADWELVNDASGNEDWNALKPTVDAHRITGMIDQLNTRQAAMDKAKAETAHSGVEVYHYTEVNLPKARSLDQNLPSILSDVLPHVSVDFVSYSCYDATRNHSDASTIDSNLKTVLDALENALPPKNGLPFDKRVFIGEFGFPNGREDKYNPAYAEPQNQTDQDTWSRYVMKTAIEWGCPFALYWTFYGNEHKTVDGIDWNTQNGYWMINSRNDKQKIYYTYQNYYARAKEGILQFMEANNNQLPTEEEFKTIALEALATAENTLTLQSFETIERQINSPKRSIVLHKSADVLEIRYNKPEKLTVDLFNSMGKVINHNYFYNNDLKEIKTTHVPKGIYYLVLHFEDGHQEVHKVIVQ